MTLEKGKRIDQFIEKIIKGDLSAVESKINKGLDVNYRSEPIKWPVIISAVDHPVILKRLIEEGIDMDAQEQNKWYSALMVATKFGIVDSVQILLENGANRHLTSFADLPALFYALDFDHSDIVSLLIEYETDDSFLENVITLCEQKKVDISRYLKSIRQKISIIRQN